MLKENKVLMQEAREALEGNWSVAVGATAVFLLVSFVAGMVPLGGLIIGGPMAFGVATFFLALSRKQVPVLNDLFKGFTYFLNTLVAVLLVALYTFLWMLLLIVPGIIAAISYSQVFFILAENPSMSASDAIAKSKKMMDGYKWKYFCLGFRFIGWMILSAFTMGIGLLWLVPYMQTTLAKFHDDIKDRDTASSNSSTSAETITEVTASPRDEEVKV